MPIRAIGTPFSRLLERRHASARPGRRVADGPHPSPAGESETDRPFDDWPFDYEPDAERQRR